VSGIQLSDSPAVVNERVITKSLVELKLEFTLSKPEIAVRQVRRYASEA
jgi:hypothetical protein